MPLLTSLMITKHIIMNTANQFWDWFKRNEAQYFFINQNNDPVKKEKLLDDLLLHLHRFCNKLYFEIGGHPDANHQNLIITAEGNIDFFEQVEALVALAPHLEYWNVTAFKPPMKGYIIKYAGLEFNPETMWFKPLYSPTVNKFSLKVYFENYDALKNEIYRRATYLTLDNVLGEKSAVLDIGHIEIANLSTDVNREELFTFDTLESYIERIKKHRN